MADLFFAEAGVEQRGEDAVLMRGAMTGTKIASVIGIDSIGDGEESAGDGELFHSCKKLVLAVITAIGVVGDVEGICEFPRLDKFVADARGADKSLNIFVIKLGEAGGKRGHRKRPMADRAVRCPGKISGIDAARKSNQ